jgi:pimeloyl-ACP methyl ester carboxylesterase
MLFGVEEQLEKFDALCRFGGSVEAELQTPPADKAPLIVVLARLKGADPTKLESWEVADHFVREVAGLWEIAAAPGTYGMVAFQDLNRDLKAQPDEPYLRADFERLITCKAGERHTGLALRIPAAGRSRISGTISIEALTARSQGEQLALSFANVTAVGEIAGLADPRFTDEVAGDGLWRPYDFLFKGRPGVYLLGVYDPAKMPVLFVHGINGTPRNFSTLIERLDRSRFQPWVYYYPSGASLDSVADHLARTMHRLHVRYHFNSFVVVAHSMGGLVSRGFLQRYVNTGGGTVPLFVSIATPWDGHKAAELGVKTAPEVVRVWIDMSPGSDYLKSIYEKDPGVPHHLLFSFRNDGGLSFGEANDGTVSVASQLRPAAQRAAVRVEGFNETHMSILEAEAVSARLNGLLATVPRP